MHEIVWVGAHDKVRVRAARGEDTSVVIRPFSCARVRTRDRPYFKVALILASFPGPMTPPSTRPPKTQRLLRSRPAAQKQICRSEIDRPLCRVATAKSVGGRRRPTEVATVSRAEALRESPEGRFALLPKPATPRVVYLIHCTFCPHG